MMYVDPTGHFITAVLVGALIGACFALGVGWDFYIRIRFEGLFL